MVKDPISTRNKQVNLLDRRGLLLMSATPLLNHLRDIEGYLNLMWDPAWPFDWIPGANDKLVETSSVGSLGKY